MPSFQALSTAIVAQVGTGNLAGAETAIGSAFKHAFNIPTIATGIALAIIADYIFIGGIDRIASVTNFLFL